MRVIAKPVYATVTQFDHEKIDELEEFLGHPVFDIVKETSSIDKEAKYWFKLKTLDGSKKVIEGDYIIRYDTGEYIVRTPEQFEFLFNKVR